MPKSKITLKNRIETRLSAQDYDRFSQLAKAKNLNVGQLSREAILFYLNSPKHHNAIVPETPMVVEMRGMTNRICAMLFRMHKDISVLYTLTWDGYRDGEDHVVSVESFNSAIARSKGRIRKPMDAEEKKEGAEYKNTLLDS